MNNMNAFLISLCGDYFRMPNTALKANIEPINKIMLEIKVACGNSAKRKYTPTKPITIVTIKNL